MERKKELKSASRGTKQEESVLFGIEKKGTAKNCASVNMPRMAKELEIHADQSCWMIKTDEEAVRFLSNSISDWVPVNIYLDILDLMRWLEPKLAMKVAHYIGDFCWGEGRTLTDIDFLDCQLLGIYKRIYDFALANGHKLGMTCPF